MPETQTPPVLPNPDEIEKQATILDLALGRAESYAAALEVKTNEDEAAAIKELAEISSAYKEGSSAFDYLTAPFKEGVKRLKNVFDPRLKKYDAAIEVIRRKLSAFKTEQDRIAKEAEANTLGKLERGTILPQTAVRQLSKIPEAKKTVRTDEATVTYVTDYDVQIVDESKLPREYLKPDAVKIRQMALALHKTGQAQIPGVNVVETKSPRMRSNI